MSYNRKIPVRELVTFCLEGNIKLLKECINLYRNMNENIGSLINTPTNSGQTVLIAACRHGNSNFHYGLPSTGKADIVEYLVDECGADIEQVGTVHFDEEAVEGVTPLWCAAAANYIQIVKFLVSRGADVNRTTITNSTALRAACFDGHEEVGISLVYFNTLHCYSSDERFFSSFDS